MNQIIRNINKKFDAFNHKIILQLPQAIAIFNEKLQYVEVSNKWLSDYNLERSHIIGKSHYEVFPEIGNKWKAIHQECLNGAIKKNDGDRFERSDGSIQWLKWEVKPWYDISGHIGGIIISSEDITIQKNKQIKLQESKKLLLEATKVSKVGGWEYDVLKNKLQWSSVTKEIHEVQDNSIPNITTWLDFYLEGEDREVITNAFNKTYEKGKSFNLELKIKTQKENIKWVRIIGKASFKLGKCIRVYGTLQNINDYKILEEKLVKNEVKFRDAFNYSAIGMAIISLKGKWIETNNRACEIMGYTRNELKDLTFQNLTHPDDLTISAKLIAELLSEKKDYFHLEKRYFHKKGHVIWVSLAVSMVTDINGNQIHFIAQLKDITKLKKKEEEVKKLYNITVKQNQRLLNFAHIVSHNLRSHSANISSLLSLYNEENNEDDKNEIVEMINKSSKNLNLTISNLNEVVAINNRINENKVKINLLQDVKKTLLKVKALIEEKEATIKINIPESIYLKSIPAYMENIMLNLITNGIKYRSKNRKPILIISAEEKPDYTQIEVKDNGIGIDLKKNGEKLFGMYKTFHNNKDARGIGLFITKNQIDALGGEINAISEIDKGTTFKIKFYEKY